MSTTGEGTACICGGGICGSPPLRWTCKGCKRFVPYCNGASLDDGLDDLCDQCWSKAVRGAECECHPAGGYNRCPVHGKQEV